MARLLKSVLAVLLGTATIAGLMATETADTAVGQVGQPDVVIVGNSLTEMNSSYIDATLRAAGLDPRVEGLCLRRIAVSFFWSGYRDSGIERIRALRAAGVDPELWVIELGTNDLAALKESDDPIVDAGDMIDRLLAELPPETPVAWVTVMNRADFDTTNAFNEAVRRRAVVNPYVRWINWAGLSLQHPDWFVDGVHLTPEGVIRFTQMYRDEILALLARPPGPVPPLPGLQRAVRLGTPLR